MLRPRLAAALVALAGCVDDPVFVGDGDTTAGTGGAATTATTGLSPTTGSTTSSDATTTATTGGQGGSGGSGGGVVACPGMLVPPAPPCGGLTDTFDDSQSLMSWSISGALIPSHVEVQGGELRIHKASSQSSTFVESLVDVTLNDCALWARIEPESDPTVQTRVSFGNTGDPAMMAVGHHDGEIVAWLSGSQVVGTDPFAASTTRYVRMREENGSVLFGHSADGICWTEFAVTVTPNEDTARVRLVVQAGFAAGTSFFDDFGVTPP